MPSEVNLPRNERDAAQRAQAIVASLQKSEPGSTEVFAAFWELDALPADVVRDAVAEWLGPTPNLERMDDAARRAFGLPPRALHLVTINSVRDADVLDMGDVAEEQLRLAGLSWDGLDLAPEERLDGEREDSFAGNLELRVLADASAPERALYDVMLFAPDGGLVFEAGTTRQIGNYADGRVEVRDARVRAALEEALAHATLREAKVDASKTPANATPAVEATPKVAAKKPARKAAVKTKASAAKTTAPKKAASKESAPKKTAVKKAAAKKATKTPTKSRTKKKTAD